jgi:gluconokinase
VFAFLFTPLKICSMIVIVAGPSGSGKTTVGAMLAGRLRWPFVDADMFHSAANIAKMHEGIPLTDEDRWPWLEAIAAWMDERIAAGQDAVVACSALKESYRDLLRDGRPQTRLVFLRVDGEQLARRLAIRHEHFFSPRLLTSQLNAVEVPEPAEHTMVLTERAGPDETVDQIVSWLAEAR